MAAGAVDDAIDKDMRGSMLSSKAISQSKAPLPRIGNQNVRIVAVQEIAKLFLH